MPVASDHPAFNDPKHVQSYLHLASVATGILVQKPLSYHDVRRVLEIEGETVTARGEDALARILAERLDTVCESPGALVDAKASLAALFDRGALPKSLQPRVLLAHNLRGGAALAGALILCRFLVDATLGTGRFDESYRAKHALPALDQYWFIDVVCSKTQPSATLLVLSAYALTAKTKPPAKGIAAVAISRQALRVFQELGFAAHPYREQNQQRWLVHATHGDVTMARAMQRLRFDGHREVVSGLCFRMGLTKASADKIVARC